MQIMQLTQTIHLIPPLLTRSGRSGKAGVQPMLPGLEAEPVEKPVVTNRQIAEVLSNITEILEIQNDNPYRIQAYRNAARGILALEEPASDILARGEALPIPGLGPRLRKRIAELVETGTMTFYNNLSFLSLPRGVRTLMGIQYVGVNTAMRLYQDLDIDSPEKLWNAAQQQRIRQLPGFGPRSEERLREATEHFLGQKTSEPLGGAA